MTTPLSFRNFNNYIAVHRGIGKKIGAMPSLFLSELMDVYDWVHKSQEFVSHKEHGDDWFFMTLDKVSNDTGMTRDEQESAIKKLIKEGVIEVKVFGVPAKRHFRLNISLILELHGVVTNNSSLRKTHKLVCASDCGKPTNWIVENPQTGHIYIPPRDIQPKQDNFTHMRAHGDKKKSDESPPPLDKIERAQNVFTSEQEHKKLVEKHSEALTQEAYEFLSIWKESADPKQVAKHKSDYGRITSWVMKKVHENQAASKKLAREISYQQKNPSWKVPNHPKDNYKPEEL